MEKLDFTFFADGLVFKYRDRTKYVGLYEAYYRFGDKRQVGYYVFVIRQQEAKEGGYIERGKGQRKSFSFRAKELFPCKSMLGHSAFLLRGKRDAQMMYEYLQIREDLRHLGPEYRELKAKAEKQAEVFELFKKKLPKDGIDTDFRELIDSF